MRRRVVLPAGGIAFGTLALLGILITWVGASRAYVVGVHTVYQDHLASLALTLAIGAVAAILVGRMLVSGRELAIAIATVVATDVLVAILITFAFNEMREHPDIPRAVFAETAGGAQVAVLAVGLAIGRLARRASREWRLSR